MNLSQAQLAMALDVRQPSVAKIEKKTDMYISTLRRFIEAMVGQLEIRAHFPDGDVRINQFSELHKKSSLINLDS
ncbi:MAG: XRE family transcriptional regulator [Gammaproteobacteria bacterium]|nr:XRE family transcriptional regulator [Gammaproteobacteria bacterium]